MIISHTTRLCYNHHANYDYTKHEKERKGQLSCEFDDNEAVYLSDPFTYCAFGFTDTPFAWYDTSEFNQCGTSIDPGDFPDPDTAYIDRALERAPDTLVAFMLAHPNDTQLQALLKIVRRYKEQWQGEQQKLQLSYDKDQKIRDWFRINGARADFGLAYDAHYDYLIALESVQVPNF